MDEKNFNNPSGPNQSGEPSFGAPPKPEINLRTMQSDINSIQSGEATPIPRSVLPPENDREPVFKPETQLGSGKPELDALAPPKSGKKVLVGIILILVLAAAGFGVWYFMFKKGAAEVARPAPPPPAGEPAPLPVPHSSLFIVPPQQTSEMRLSNFLTTTIISNFQILSALKLPDGSVQEVAVLDELGGQAPFGFYLNAFVPTLAPAAIANWFEDDFTAFLFYNRNGVWPGYIARVKNGVNINEARTAMTSLESAELDKFYLSSSGAFSSFKDGQISGKATRYAVGSATGASFNYGFLNGYFVISTSYDGLKAAAALLGI